jgi:UDP-glucose 4-epimerase
MKIAITGGAGFVGSHLAAACLDAGHDVFIVDTLVNGSGQAAGSLDPRARFYAVDIRDAQLHTIFQNERPDIVSHHAAQQPQRFYGTQAMIDADVHIRGLLNVLEACVGASVQKLIFASNGTTMYRPATLSAYAQQEFLLVKEDAPLCPQRPADISKVAGEWYVRCYTLQHGLAHTILRYADIYGESDLDNAQHPSAYFAAMLAANQRPVIRGSGQDIRDHIFIDDVVRANLRALERGKNCTLHISSGKGYSQHQFFCAIAQQLSSALLPVYLASTNSEPTAVVLDNSLAWQELGWRPQISFTAGIERTVARLCGNMVHSHAGQTLARERVEAAVLV